METKNLKELVNLLKNKYKEQKIEYDIFYKFDDSFDEEYCTCEIDSECLCEYCKNYVIGQTEYITIKTEGVDEELILKIIEYLIKKIKTNFYVTNDEITIEKTQNFLD